METPRENTVLGSLHWEIMTPIGIFEWKPQILTCEVYEFALMMQDAQKFMLAVMRASTELDTRRASFISHH